MCASRVDGMETKLREMFEIRSGYGDENRQAALLAKHFRNFDRDGSGVLDFDEFARAMLSLNFVGVQAETEALFDRYDVDLDGVLSYGEFARAVTGSSGHVLLTGKTRSLLERVRESVLNAGGKNGIRTLGVILRRMDQNGNGVIELEEFRDGIAQLGVTDADPKEVEYAFRCYDRDQSGKITIEELMRGLRGSMPKRRILLVKKAFALLDTSGDGKATVEEVERLYDASQHPEVIAGRMKPRDAMLEMMGVFEQSDSRGDGVITWHEFLEYYKDLSAGIGHDDEFELIVRNAWHLSGGVGWSTNSSCRRVLATFRDGSQRVLEIENDISIGAFDTRRMMEKLVLQGYRDIVGISLAQ
ncbi:Calcyphosin [Phytophthora megakarya]|uniref:Calcyphosin n=1 Tax=Phytophthora megakarya TaxID=4795 RepID=A0A225V615_9STRA|nr:Calcyphosin [Phytophthora megakarya]